MALYRPSKRPHFYIKGVSELFEEEEGEGEPDEPYMCSLCRGSGIGQFGDPDTSRCHECNGTGVEQSHD